MIKIFLISPAADNLDYLQSQVRSAVIENISLLLGVDGETIELDEAGILQAEKQYAEEDTPCAEIVFMLEQVTPGVSVLPKLYIFSWGYSELPACTAPDQNLYSFFTPQDLAVVCLSHLAETVISPVLPAGLPVFSLPGLASTPNTGSAVELNTAPRILTDIHNDLDGPIIDSINFDYGHETHKIGKYGDLHPSFGIIRLPWNGEDFDVPCTASGYGPQFMSGFYETESWGTWSKSSEPTINLPYVVQGKISVAISAIGHGRNVDRDIEVAMGSQTSTIRLQSEHADYSIQFNIEEPQDKLVFRGFDLNPLDESPDKRTLGIALISLSISRSQNSEATKGTQLAKTRPLNGIIYTSILDPSDEKYNSIDLISAFCTALQDVSAANLVIMVPPDTDINPLGELARLISAQLPMECRLIILKGELNPHNRHFIQTISSYYIATPCYESSSGTLLDFAAKGIPVIAPSHTAILDCQDSKASLIVECSKEPVHKSLSDQEKLHSFKFRLNWESLRDQIKHAHDIAISQQSEFEALSSNSHRLYRNAMDKDQFVGLKSILMGSTQARIAASS